MKLNRFFSAVLSAALLISLCACNPTEPVEDEPPASARVSGRPSRESQTPGPSPEDSEPPESTPYPYPEYDPDYRLDVPIPALINGLEMPVVGATGYTSVELPLWPSIPEEPEESEEPEPSPSPSEPAYSEPPAVTEAPEPPPAETEEPAPDNPAEPVPDDPVEPAPDNPVEPDPGDPVPVTAPEPPAQAPEEPEPTPEQPPEITSEPVTTEPPVSAATPAPTVEPTPTPKPTETPDPYEGAVAVWDPGTAFVILQEDGDWWRVSRRGETGWIEHRYCMINLPDVIPSMIYDDTNAYYSIFVSCGKDIPGITGKALYNSLAYNDRLGRKEFLMPILYSAARNICAAQHRALAEGNCLVVYQTFRPYETQVKVAEAMKALAKEDSDVREGISTPPWSIDWFIATGVNNHQMGYALDVSMVKVYETETRYIGSRPYLYITDYEDYKMPTDMHELSMAAISTVSPSYNSPLSPTMNEPAIALRGYFTASHLSPLASEWWHFNDEAAHRAASDKPSNGRYFITECLSRLPG